MHRQYAGLRARSRLVESRLLIYVAAFFFVAVSFAMLRRLWYGWKYALVLVPPETVVRRHRTGFKSYWKWLSRHRTGAGRRCVSRELRELIFPMVAEDPTWGAPRIHGELKGSGANRENWASGREMKVGEIVFLRSF